MVDRRLDSRSTRPVDRGQRTERGSAGDRAGQGIGFVNKWMTQARTLSTGGGSAAEFEELCNEVALNHRSVSNASWTADTGQCLAALCTLWKASDLDEGGLRRANLKGSDYFKILQLLRRHSRSQQAVALLTALHKSIPERLHVDREAKGWRSARW